MAENHLQDFSLINIKGLARKTNIPYAKLRNCICGTYNSLTDAERTKLFNAMQDGVTRAASVLGFSYEGRRIKVKD